jgi:hypothetical protein
MEASGGDGVDGGEIRDRESRSTTSVVDEGTVVGQDRRVAVGDY